MNSICKGIKEIQDLVLLGMMANKVEIFGNVRKMTSNGAENVGRDLMKLLNALIGHICYISGAPLNEFNQRLSVSYLHFRKILWQQCEGFNI